MALVAEIVTVASAGTAVRSASPTVRAKRIRIQSDPSNAGTVNIEDASGNVVQILATSEVFITEASDGHDLLTLGDYYIDAANSADHVYFSYSS